MYVPYVSKYSHTKKKFQKTPFSPVPGISVFHFLPPSPPPRTAKSSSQLQLLATIKHRNPRSSLAFGDHFPHLGGIVFPRHDLLDRQAAVLFVLVVRADPALGHQVLRDLDAAGQAGVDVAAEPPRVFDPVEGVQ